MNVVPPRVRSAGVVVRALGPSWAVERAKHELRHRTGLIRRQLPATSWGAMPSASWMQDGTANSPEAYLKYRRTGAPRFFFQPDDREKYSGYFASWDRDTGGPIPIAERIVEGTFRYFSHADVDLGEVPDWHRNPFTGEQAPPNRHWTEIGDFRFGDIKVIWEPSRFGWSYDLVRAYWRTGDERFAERFWRLLESWRAANPPNQGPNWKCGQETSLRVMAWCFALHGFLAAKATTPARVFMLSGMIAFSGKRIEATLGYALSQRNNHGVSEGMGLWTIGALFPEFRDAARWRMKGRDVLERLGRELIYDDGAFSQHSTNYHRVMLHDYAWSLRLGEMIGQPFSSDLYARVDRATALLYQLQDDLTGEVPCYGANDGAMILPLSTSAYEDYRPTIQACRAITARRRTYGAGPWDETLLWLLGFDSLDLPIDVPQRVDVNTSSGYATLRTDSGFLFTRSPERFEDRPSHADMLHTDIWWKGINIALDPGTFSYNALPPLDKALASTDVHNTVTVDGVDQMGRVGRFLWAPWAQGGLSQKQDSPAGFFSYLEGWHNGYVRLADPVSYRRGIVRLGEDRWLVLDQLQGRERHAYRLHWHLADLPFQRESKDASQGRIQLQSPYGTYQVVSGCLEAAPEFSVQRAPEASAAGWRSTHYLSRSPALSCSASVTADKVSFWTVLGPGSVDDVKVTASASELSIHLPGTRVVATLDADALVSRLHAFGEADQPKDSLEVA